jgi:serine/threonine-protein kinase RsbW
MQYNYSAQCSKKNLADIRDFINKILNNHFKSEIEIHHMVLAVDEVCANLMIHSHKCNPEESIELFVDVKEHEVIFEIKDTGNGFNIKNYQEPTINEIIVEKKKGGLGLMLVKRIMDKVEFIKNEDNNICRLKKKILTS